MRNAFTVNDALVVGRDQPRSDDFRVLADEGVRAVLDLRVEGENEQPLPPRDEEVAVRHFGLDYAHLPVPVGRMDDELIDAFRRELNRLPRPVFVHCASGKRSGTLAFIQAAIDAGLSGTQMLDRAEKAGASYGSEQMRDTVKQYVDRHTTGRQKTARDLPPGSSPKV